MTDRREYIYYPGCSLEGTAAAYDASIRCVMKSLGVSLVEPPDWSCCGASPAHAFDHLLSGALTARNLQIVERMGADALMTPCPACLSAFKKTQARMEKNKVFREDVNGLLDAPYNCTVTAKSALQVLYEDVGLEEMARPVKFSLPDLRIAPYYGCMLSRPPKLAAFDDPENPVSMDRILEAVGVNVVDFAFKLECCGAAFGLPKREIVINLTSKVLAMAAESGANCIAVACPLCQQNLDLRQAQVNSAMGTSFAIPVLYFSQIMGLAYGCSPGELGLTKNIVSADGLVKSRAPVEKAADAAEKGEQSEKESAA